jgi:mRNA interferase MazF
MKVSVSLPADDVEFLDSYAHAQGIESRSAALHKAVSLLRAAQLTTAYEDAWESWTESGDAGAWEAVAADGLGTWVRRGEIVTVSLDPVRGSEAAKTRPAVVVSNDAANATATRLGRGVVTVVPVTSNTARVYPFQVLLPARLTGLPHDSKAQAEQVRSVAVERIGARAGQLPAALIAELDQALRIHLNL